MKILAGVVLINLMVTSLYAQEDSIAKVNLEIISQIEPYGSIRMGAGFTDQGESGVTDNASRIGLRLKHTISENNRFAVIGRVEMGLNLVNRDETVNFAPGANPGVTQAGDAVFARVGYLGIAFHDLQITFGKQNSVYYTLGAIESVDRFLAFGGEATGVWNIADGGVSGTGRANRAALLTYKKNGLQLGAQMQARNISENSSFADGYGFGANYSHKNFGVGVGYNRVLDGIDDPDPNQAKTGDEAFITSASYEAELVTLAFSYARMLNHLKTGDTFFDANGFEFYLGYTITRNKKWTASTGFSWIRPDRRQDLGDFDRKFAILELAYFYHTSGNIFATVQIEQSNDATGERTRPNAFGIGFRFGF